MHKSLIGSLTLLLVACQVPTQPLPAPQATASVPTPTPEPSLTATPAPAPTPTPEGSPVLPTPSPTVTFSPMPLPSLLPVPTPEASTWKGDSIYLTPFKGRIFDEQGTPLAGAKVLVEMNAVGIYPAYRAETLSNQNGEYTLTAPSGAWLSITVSAPGLTTRKRLEALKIGKGGHPFDNRFDFGVNEADYLATTDQYSRAVMDASRLFALEKAPEVISISPDLKSLKIAPDTALTLSFNEPVDRSSVEKSLVIRSSHNQKLRVDHLSGSHTFLGSGNSEEPNGSLIWNAEAFDFEWNVGDTRLRLRFKPGHQFPANQNDTDFPGYLLSFNAAPEQEGLSDKAGEARSKNWFRMQTQQSEQSVMFRVGPDKTPLTLEKLAFIPGQAETPPVLHLDYSKPVWLATRSRVVAGGMADFYNLPGAELQAPAEYPENKGNATARNAAKNYRVLILRPTEVDFTVFSGTWYDLGGSVVYDSSDVTHRRVLLQLPKTYNPSYFASGYEIQINGVNAILDPAGNPLTVGTPLKVKLP